MNHTSNTRRRTKLAGVLVAAAALGLSIITATPASAATLGTVTAVGDYSGPNGNTSRQAWYSTWSDAYRFCRQDFPRTKSVEMLGYSARQALRDVWTYTTTWACRDTP